MYYDPNSFLGVNAMAILRKLIGMNFILFLKRDEPELHHHDGKDAILTIISRAKLVSSAFRHLPAAREPIHHIARGV